MLRLSPAKALPAPLHRLLYRMAHGLRRRWWRVRGPRGSSVVVAAFDERGRVLLVRHSYGPPAWTLPGGGIARGERPEAAAARELREELGCTVAGLEELEPAEPHGGRARATQHVMLARLASRPVPDMREIVAVLLAEPAHLPGSCGPRTRRRIARAAAAWRRAAPSQQR